MTEKICTLLFLRKDDEILLAMKKRGFGMNRYNGVGGKIEPNETEVDAMIRECQEEIGVTPTNFWKVAEHDFVQEESGEHWRMIVHAYMCDAWDGTPIETDEMAPEWFRIADIPYDNMWQDDKFWLPQVLAGQKIFGKFTFDEQENVPTHDVKQVEEFNNVTA